MKREHKKSVAFTALLIAVITVVFACLVACGSNTAPPQYTGDVTVTFNAGRDVRMSGVYNPAAVTVTAGSTIAEPQLTCDDYTLDGWYAEEGSTKWNFATDKVTGNTTLFAKWTRSSASPAYTPTMTDNNTLYIHYLRRAGDYDNWYIYNWGNNGSQEIKSTVANDASGTVFAINLNDNINKGRTTINIIVTMPGWVKDGGDINIALSATQKVGDSYHWYLTEGNTANGGAEPIVFTPISGTTEPKRASVGNVDRQYAKNLPVMNTVDGWDEVGVGYQIFVASFCDSNGDGVGDLNGITSKLDYLKSLNVDVLWLTPVQASPTYHSYDCDDYYYINKKFGTQADYRRLVNEVHKRGMKIIMDLVVNHTSPNNEWFQKSKAGVIEEVTYQDGTKATVNYRDFYRWSQTKSWDNGDIKRSYDAGDGWYYYGAFGAGMPDLNYDYQPVRDAMVDVASYWMSYGLDGFRMDAVPCIFMWEECDNTGDSSGGDEQWKYNITKDVEFFKEFNYKLKTKYPHCFLLGEQLSGDPSAVSPFYQGMDSLFDFYTYYNLPNNDAPGLAFMFNSNAQKYETDRGDRPINSMISSNHDINRLNSIIGGNTEKAKLYMSVIMTMPGLSWIYYGDEIGLKAAADAGGDNAFRQSMKWTSSWANKCTAIPDGNGNGNTISVADQEKDNNSLLSYIKTLTKFRNDNPALINGKATCSESNGMLKIVVTGGGKTCTVYHNFSNSSKSITGNIVFGNKNIPAYGTAIVG